MISWRKILPNMWCNILTAHDKLLYCEPKKGKERLWQKLDIRKEYDKL